MTLLKKNLPECQEIKRRLCAEHKKRSMKFAGCVTHSMIWANSIVRSGYVFVITVIKETTTCCEVVWSIIFKLTVFNLHLIVLNI